MSCLVRLYEPNAAVPPGNIDLTAATIDLVAVDQGTHANRCRVQSNGSLGSGGYGADLIFPAAAFTYQVTIVDGGRTYGGATIPNLNGNVAGKLDVVLHPLPPPTGSGPTGATASQMVVAVLAFAGWTESQRLAVLGTIAALTSLRGATSQPLRDFVALLEGVLRDRSIKPDLF